MKHLLLAATACGLVLAAASGTRAELRATTGPVPPQPIVQFADAINAGDVEGAARFLAPSATFADDSIPPFFFHSFAAWNSARIKHSNAGYHIELHYVLAAGSGSDLSAFAVQPAIITYKLGNSLVTEKGMINTTEAKRDGVRQITSLSFVRFDLQEFWDSELPGHLQAK